MLKRNEWIKRIKAVESEHLVAMMAVALLRERLRTEPHFLKGKMRSSEVTGMTDRLEMTYLVRLYAVFEAGLREAWKLALGRDTQPPMRDLLDGIGSNRRIENDLLVSVHDVRMFRNNQVHEQDEELEEHFTISQARSHLTRFFSYLPPNW